jgi:hypothetical protein
MIPRDLAQARHVELLERALAWRTLGRRSGLTSGERSLGEMSRDQLIVYVLQRRGARKAS